MATYTSDYTGEETDNFLAYVSRLDQVDSESLLAYVSRLEQLNSEPIGILWDKDSNSHKLTRIDINGNTLPTTTSYFDKHRIWGGMRRCTINRATKAITYGKNNRGDGLVLDGSTGEDVFVSCPAINYKYDLFEGDPCWWVIPYSSEDTLFKNHPAIRQYGKTPTIVFYIGAKEASGYLDPSDSKFKLASVSGKQPVTGGVGYTDLPNSGRFNLDDAELYSKNAGYSGIGNVWTYAYIQLLMYIELGTLDSQTSVGKGVTDLPVGEGFAGVLTGADDIDSRLGTNGTGVGSGVEGKTPICWRGIENPYGNVWEFVAGINMFLGDGTDASGDQYTAGSYRILKRDGTGTIAATLPKESYEIGIGEVPIGTDGYISGIQSDELGALAFIPSASAGSSSTYFCDEFKYPRYNPSIMLSGGYWNSTRNAGISCMRTSEGMTASSCHIGARLLFHPNEVTL